VRGNWASRGALEPGQGNRRLRRLRRRRGKNSALRRSGALSVLSMTKPCGRTFPAIFATCCPSSV